MTRPSSDDGSASSTSRRRPGLPGRARASAAASRGTGAETKGARAAKSPGQGNGLEDDARQLTNGGSANVRTVRWADLQRDPGPNVPHMAMPRLTGQPAYARPPRILAAEAERPFDPDDLPLEAFRSDEERDIAEQLARRSTAASDGHDAALQPSSIGGLRAIAGRLFGSRA